MVQLLTKQLQDGDAREILIFCTFMKGTCKSCTLPVGPMLGLQHFRYTLLVPALCIVSSFCQLHVQKLFYFHSLCRFMKVMILMHKPCFRWGRGKKMTKTKQLSRKTEVRKAIKQQELRSNHEGCKWVVPSCMAWRAQQSFGDQYHFNGIFGMNKVIKLHVHVFWAQKTCVSSETPVREFLQQQSASTKMVGIIF